MRDCRHAQLFLGPLWIDMDPLMVACRFSEHIDPLLIDLDPVADADFFSFFRRVVSNGVKNAHKNASSCIFNVGE